MKKVLIMVFVLGCLVGLQDAYGQQRQQNKKDHKRERSTQGLQTSGASNQKLDKQTTGHVRTAAPAPFGSVDPNSGNIVEGSGHVRDRELGTKGKLNVKREGDD